MGARALISPIDWEEPFGLMMIEAMACGTPVISTRRGAVPEIVEHGKTGVVVDNYRDMEEPDGARARRLARPGRHPQGGRDALLAGDHGGELRRRVRGDDRSRPGDAPLAVRPRDLPARAPGAGRARGGTALPARRHGDRRPSRSVRSSPRSASRSRSSAARSRSSTSSSTGRPRRSRVRAEPGRRRRRGASARRRSGSRSRSASRSRRSSPRSLRSWSSLMGGEGQAADYAVTYLRIAAIGFPAAFLALGAQGYLRGVADLRTPLVDPHRRERRERRPRGALRLRLRLGDRGLGVGDGSRAARDGGGVRRRRARGGSSRARLACGSRSRAACSRSGSGSSSARRR